MRVDNREHSASSGLISTASGATRSMIAGFSSSIVALLISIIIVPTLIRIS